MDDIEFPEREGLDLLRAAEPVHSALVSFMGPHDTELVTGGAIPKRGGPTAEAIRNRRIDHGLETWDRDGMRDHISRWTLFRTDDTLRTAHLVFEFYESDTQLVMRFSYPEAREPLWAIALSGWAAMTENVEERATLFAQITTHDDLREQLEELDAANGFEKPTIQDLHRLAREQGDFPTDEEIELFRQSPALALAHTMMEEQQGEAVAQDDLEKALKDLLHRKAPVWSGARGFNESYTVCKGRAAILKQLIEKERPLDDLSVHHACMGALMQDAHVVQMTSAQIIALKGRTPTEELMAFMRSGQLPFEKVFLDFTGDTQMISNQSPVSATGQVEIIGVLMYRYWAGRILALVPFFNYPSADKDRKGNPLADGVVTTGTVFINMTSSANLRFQYLGNWHQFELGQKEMVVPAMTDVLVREQEIAQTIDHLYSLVEEDLERFKHPEIGTPAYRYIKEQAKRFGIDAEIYVGMAMRIREAGTAVDAYRELLANSSILAAECLHFIEAANVETVKATLEKRDRKRAEKRGWDIPDVVRVQRPVRRRESAQNGSAEPVGMEYSHQFDVIGYVRHVTKGNHVHCRVCKGQEMEGLPCSRCKGTGLDPDLVKPCWRIDVDTGLKTCPDGCRREFTPGYVKGDPDKPYVPKARKIVGTP